MIIKKYQARNEADAIILAKEDLGKDTIIMNVTKITPKGLGKLFKKSKVEVTAAVDDGKSYANAEKKANNVAKNKSNKKLDNSKKVSQEENNEDFEHKLENIQNLIEKNLEKYEQEEKEKEKNKNKILNSYINDGVVKDNITTNNRNTNTATKDEVLAKEEKLSNKKRDVTENNRKTKNDSRIEIEEKESIVKKSDDTTSKSDKCISLIKKQMLKHEVDEKYIDMIFNEVKSNIKKDAPVDNILTSIYQKIILKLGQPKLIEPGENQPKYIFFMGPTGVGKTTTIAKIASDFKIKRKLNIALVTADTYRVAAVEQLRTYANILSVPVKVLYSAEDMEKLKPMLDRYDVVLIDTAGRSHKNAKQRDDLRALINSIDEKERDAYLVLSATTKYNDLTNIVESYSDIKNYKLLFTKIDETTSIGNILNIKLLTNAQLSYIACGQEVPDDISKLDAQGIAKQLLGGDM